MVETTSHSRQLIAQHNLHAILDAAERVLRRGEEPTISAVAKEAGLSRPTVYAHFPDRTAILGALVERTVRHTMEAISTVEPDRGPAAEALQRLIATGWQRLADHEEIANAAAGELSGEAMRAAHHSARSALGDLIERGRQDGSFRTDLPTSWLTSAVLALIHATSEETRAGELRADTALEILATATSDLLNSGLGR